MKEGLKPGMEGAGHETPAESLTEAQVGLTELGSREVQESAKSKGAVAGTHALGGKQALTQNLLARVLSYVDASGMNCMCCLSIEIA